MHKSFKISFRILAVISKNTLEEKYNYNKEKKSAEEAWLIFICSKHNTMIYNIRIQDNKTFTERQKKLITSSERHSLKFTTSKLITFGHR